MTTLNTRSWPGRIVSGLPVLFLIFDAIIKLANIPAVAEGSAKLGLPADLAPTLGVVLLACVALYVWPRTAPIGAVLLTGYLGGAVLAHVRVGDPLFSHALFPIYVAVFLWGGLYLRDPRVRALVAVSKSPAADRRVGVKAIASIGLVLGACHVREGEAAMTTTNGTVPVNGVTYYYEIHGHGEPLLLLHGGLGSIDMFCPGLDELAKTHEVIAVDLQGHGRSTLGDRPIDLADMGNDMAVILAKVGAPKADVVGYSMGAGVAFRLAVQHPESVRRLVLISAAFSQDGFFPEMIPMQAAVSSKVLESMKATPMYQGYVKVAPRPEDFGKLLDRMGELMRKPYDWTGDIAKVQAPTLLVYGDADMMRLEHVIDAYHRFGGGQRDAGWQREHMAKNRLAILPDVTHYEMAQARQLIPSVLPFLEQR
jgi:pimeloyl-ACP methyl ester carboxylesterase